MRYILFLSLLSLFSCKAQNSSEVKSETKPDTTLSLNKVEIYRNDHPANELSSKSVGTVDNGSLVNGKLILFEGNNFHYFDTLSYISGRAYVNDKLNRTLISTYSELEKVHTNREYCIMECSNEKGGKIYPHRTHQNGLSVDFMCPLIKNSKPYYGLDSLGGNHYLLNFDKSGKYSEDQSISIDFETLAEHLWYLEQNAHKNGLKIAKVILKTELKDELFATVYGKKLKQSGIYFTKNLTPMINELHDDHYHVDFENVK